MFFGSITIIISQITPHQHIKNEISHLKLHTTWHHMTLVGVDTFLYFYRIWKWLERTTSINVYRIPIWELKTLSGWFVVIDTFSFVCLFSRPFCLRLVELFFYRLLLSLLSSNGNSPSDTVSVIWNMRLKSKISKDYKRNIFLDETSPLASGALQAGAYSSKATNGEMAEKEDIKLVYSKYWWNMAWKTRTHTQFFQFSTIKM